MRGAGRWLAGSVALVLLVLGLTGLAIRHLPPTTWAVPIAAGDEVAGHAVHRVERSATRVEVRLDGVAGEVRLVDRRAGVAAVERVTERVRVVGEGEVPAEVLEAVAARVSAWEQRVPRPPRFVQRPGVEEPPRHAVEAATLTLTVLLGLVAWVAALPWWGRALAGVSWRVWGAALGIAALPAVIDLVLGVPGVWHSNLHGLDRIADVEQLTPPGTAALGRLHGYGYYVVFQPLWVLTQGAVPVVHLALVVAGAAVFGVFLWLRLFWQEDRAALLGSLWFATLPTWLKIAGSEDMYVPMLAALVFALFAFEGFLRANDARWLGLAVPPAVLAMQTRAELLLLLPVWLLLAWALRAPGTLVRAWSRPGVLGAVALGGLLLAPRVVGIALDPPPPELQRTAMDPLRDPRVALLILMAVVAMVLAGPSRRALASVGVRARWVMVGLGAAGLAYAGFLVWIGGPEQRTWQVHPLVDPRLAAPWVLLPVLGGAWRTARLAPARLAWALLAGAGTTWIYLPQIDCLSTFVRTGATTLPLLAALAGWGLASLRGSAPFGLLALLSLGGLAWSAPWLVLRSPKQVTGDLVQAAREALPPGATVVALLAEDVPADLPDGLRVARLRVQHVLGPDVRVVSARAWLGGEVEGPVWFLRTADCHHLLLGRDGVAWAGDRAVTWRYRDTSTLETGVRIDVDGLPADWIDPTCARLLAGAAPVFERELLPWNDGSIGETVFGTAPRVGLYQLAPFTPPSLEHAALPGQVPPTEEVR